MTASTPARSTAPLRRLPWATLTLAALACLVQTHAAWGQALEFHRPSVNTQGEVWRLFTAHLTHFSQDHLIWDVAALLILGLLAECENRRGFALTLAGSSLAIGLGVWALQPQFETYRGLSGLDSALYGLVCARLLLEGWRARHGFSVALGVLALAGFALKCGAELTSGSTIFANGLDETASASLPPRAFQSAPAPASYAPVPLAHLLGLLSGIAVAASEKIPRRLRSPIPSGKSLADFPQGGTGILPV